MTAPNVSTYPCTACGAELEFKPGTHALTCPYCGGENAIPEAPPVEEQDFGSMLARLQETQESMDRITTRCDSCGATTELPANVTSSACPFCGSHVVATGSSQKLVKPHAVLPFGIDRAKARALFEGWLGSLWFAPRDLKKYASVEGAVGSGSALAGVYLPYWTYDAKSTTPYTGQRGDAYYVSVPVTVMVAGKPRTQMQQVRKIRWSWVSGTVHDSFDDVLVAGSGSIAAERLRDLGDWDLAGVVKYSDDYLTGFRAESYTVDLASGFTSAQRVMEQEIRSTIAHDIGGDEQRIATMTPHYDAVTFKHVLLPIWVSAYRYRGKVYQFLVNARTGKISGERPYSAGKITLLVIGILAAIAVIALIVNASK
jgi:DNA-directed RNA polymerase subunit RPC12/RpoP